MRKFDFGQVIKNSDGSDATKDGKPFTARVALEEALVSDWTPETRPGHTVQPPAATKNKRFKLWRKLTKSESAIIEVDPDEEATLKDVAGAWGTITYGQIIDILEGPGWTPPPPMPEPKPIAAAVHDGISATDTAAPATAAN